MALSSQDYWPVERSLSCTVSEILPLLQCVFRSLLVSIRQLKLQAMYAFQFIYTRCVIIAGTPNFQEQNLVNVRFICTKISGLRHEINVAWSATRTVHHMHCLYRVTSLLTWRHCELDQHLYWYGSQTVAHPSARVSRRKADTLNTNLASSFRPMLVGHSY